MVTETKLTREDIKQRLAGLKFEMSGYDDYYGGRNLNHGKRGSCMVHNQMLLNQFADLGIYEYVEYLQLSFYKGGCYIHLQYWGEDNHICIEEHGLGTTEIIERVLDLTIYSNHKWRRRVKA